MLLGRHLIEPTDLTVEEMDGLFHLAAEIVNHPSQYLKICEGHLLATLFYEPSTRTRFSFEAAMLRLGGQVIGFSEPNSSSASKGESIADTIRTVGCYADIAVMRHPNEGAPKLASKYASIPVINAGDGGHQHPTQTLTDLFTILTYRKSLDNFTIGLCGDLKFGRTVHSLIKALKRYSNIRYVFISPKELEIPEYILDDLNPESYRMTDKLEPEIEHLDIIYMTRIQRERFINDEEYMRLKGYYILDNSKLTRAKENLMILHPLPRVDEIAPEVDQTPFAYYFQQAKCGMFIRMALIIKLLKGDQHA
jgi:aspartate carbamoyltransferase catalytic subunit